MKVLILFAHPAFQKSRSNRFLVKDLDKFEGVTFHDLYESYPDFNIDIDYEKKLCEKHDVIIFQHPFFWYSTPAILKEWQDLVLEHGWAFGSKGKALTNKLFFNSITAGGPKMAYQRESMHNNTIQDLLAPLKQTAVLCNMIPLPPFVVYGTHAIEDDALQKFKNDFIKLLNEFVEESFSIDEAIKFESLNDYLNRKEK